MGGKRGQIYLLISREQTAAENRGTHKVAVLEFPGRTGVSLDKLRTNG